MSDKDPTVTRANRPVLELHVPEPHLRPGDAPDFSAIVIPAAGSAPRPPTDAPAADTHSLATDLVRVLGDDHRAVGPWDPRIDPEIMRKMLRDMVTVRIFDDRMYRAALKLADCWCENIGPSPKRKWYDGHEELEQALVRQA